MYLAYLIFFWEDNEIRFLGSKFCCDGGNISIYFQCVFIDFAETN